MNYSAFFARFAQFYILLMKAPHYTCTQVSAGMNGGLGRVDSYLAPIRTNPENVKVSAIRLPSFYRLLSLNQGIGFYTE
jgi:hypothetical protein